MALVPRRPADLQPLAQRTRDYLAGAKAEATRRAYRSDWSHFKCWCQTHGLAELPATPETLALYLTDLADTHRTATLQRRLSAISEAHQAAGHESPTTGAAARLTWQGIRRAKGTAPAGAAPAVVEELRAMVETLPRSLAGRRDRALLLLGFAGAFRRSELVGLDVADLRATAEGLVVTLRHSKTDQEGAGRQVGIPHGRHRETCPVRALKDWLTAAGIESGPLFRRVTRKGQVGTGRLSGRAVALIVKRTAEAAGLDPGRYSGHSLRAGLATSAAAAGASERAIMAQTGHRSLAMVRRYIREGSLFRENAAAAVGL